QLVDQDGGRGAVGDGGEPGAAVDDHRAAAVQAVRPGGVVLLREAAGVVVAPLPAAELGDADADFVQVHAGAGVGAVVASRPVAAGRSGRDVGARVGGAQVDLDRGAADAAPAGVAVGRVVGDARADRLVEVVLFDERQYQHRPVGAEVLVVVVDGADERPHED